MAGQSSMSRGDQIKILVAVVALVIAAGLMGWYFGAFDSFLARKPVDPNSMLTDSQKKEADRQQKEAKKQEIIAPPSGS